ncbi:helix-turn-helix domain-containing protein [Shinella sp. CPCC 100929]|uniref:Helix-turn-helix domain-containing protein n=1 Tax=Shinella lacus TaxID=2654216 RepID=A0ABT1R8Z7_9HYPH|nr:helix-turn-helix domain-containing protein [Shinella lacus]MCQ4631650.1 helix-turn-helix domain-containing protein [Shinella lacus]
MTASRWMTMKDVCAFTRLSRESINRLRRAHRFPPPAEIAGRALFIRTEVEAWAESQETNPRRNLADAKLVADDARAAA